MEELRPELSSATGWQDKADREGKTAGEAASAKVVGNFGWDHLSVCLPFPAKLHLLFGFGESSLQVAAAAQTPLASGTTARQQRANVWRHVTGAARAADLVGGKAGCEQFSILRAFL